MTPLQAVATASAGAAAGAINTVVGSGSLITFPTLVACGVPPVSANISNSIGLVPGGVSGTWGYRHELRGLRPLLVRLTPASLLGGLTGALLLLVLPAAAFRGIVPVLIMMGLVLVVAQPRLAARAARRRPGQDDGAGARVPILARVGAFGTAVYGGYFGAAQGVLLVGVFGALLPHPMQVLNAVKNLLTTVVNATAAFTFAVVAWHRIDWTAAALVAAGSAVGGRFGARLGRRLPPGVLRGLIVTVGVVAVVRLLWA